MTLFEVLSVALALIAAVVALWAVRHSGRSAAAAEATAAEAQRSADAAERSAATSEAAHRLALRPHVVAEVVKRTRAVGPTERTRAEIVLVNRGNGPALTVAADLSMTHRGADRRLQVLPCSALDKGEEHIIPGMPSTGTVDLWGEITFQDAQGGAYRVAKAKGEETWRLLE